MGKQVIISVSREYGSGGHVIAENIAKSLGLPVYNHQILDHIAEEKGYDLSQLKKYDESRKKPFIHRTVRGMSNSPEDAVAQIQFDFLREKAKSGESFVVVGRCSESVLSDFEGLITIFVMGDADVKLKRIEETRNMTESEAIATMKRHDKNRKAYHNYYSNMKWGDSRNYDLCVNSSKLGLAKTSEIVEAYVKERIANQ